MGGDGDAVKKTLKVRGDGEGCRGVGCGNAAVYCDGNSCCGVFPRDTRVKDGVVRACVTKRVFVFACCAKEVGFCKDDYVRLL